MLSPGVGVTSLEGIVDVIEELRSRAVVTSTSPRNLLVIVGALEPATLRNEGLRIVNLAVGGAAIPSETYGHFLTAPAASWCWRAA